MIYKKSDSLTSNKKGQTLVIAIMVMFVLAMIAAVFIALIAKNLFRSERVSNMDAVTQIAEAGIRYADKMLVTSEDGADWRPIPQDCDIKPDGHGDPTIPLQPDPLDNWKDIAAKDPDFYWTRAYWPTELPSTAAPGKGYAGPSGGYTQFNTGDGRYLLRISYKPDKNDPLSKYIKIESVGRLGVFDENDPTTGRPNADYRLKRELTAYKPIGVTDYLRFITNKDNRSADFALGCPGFNIKMGRNTTGWVRGAPVRVNGNLTLYGNSGIELFLRGYDAPSGEISSIDRFEIAGDVKFDANLNLVSLHPIKGDGTTLGPVADIKPSDDPLFSTANGFFRDAYEKETDATRRVKRVEAPLVDQPDNTNTTTRYRLLTLNSGERIEVPAGSGNWFNRGAYGWGRGIYINNLKDTQNESETLFGGYSIRYDWLKPNNPASRYWVGPYYVPPAVIIDLLPDKQINGQYYFKMTRTDTTSTGQKAVWSDAWGNARPDWGQTILMPYPDAKLGRTIENSVYSPPGGGSDIKIDGNGVIYAEGNIRIRGMLPPDTQLTVVSNENIYIDGNLLKNRTGAPSAADQYRGANSKCGLALLAHENICVNTTQFFSPVNSVSADDVGSDADNGAPPFHILVNNSPESRFRCGFEFGPWESETSSTAPDAWRLYLRHSGQFGPSYINAWLNPGGCLYGTSTPIDNGGILGINTVFTGANGLQSWVWGVGDPHFNMNGQGVGSAFALDVFPLTNSINAYLYTNPGAYNTLMLALDQTTYTRNNYRMGGIAVQPNDIRIEAVLYAQEGSFYVLPGNWFNPNTSDVNASNRVGYTNEQKRFPFYGQPLDIRIIIDGAVSENIPAPISDVEEWMSKWGKIPSEYGSSGEPTAHPGEGLTFLYDDHAGWPLDDVNSKPIRSDKFGRALPIAPRLPVSSSLIYFGDLI